MADLALAGGIGQGLMNFANSYTQAQQQKVSNQRNQQYADMAEGNYKAGLLEKGITQDDQGNQTFTPAKQAQVDAQNKINQETARISGAKATAGTPESDATYNNYVSRYEQVMPGSSSRIPKGLSGQEYDSIWGPHLEKMEDLANKKEVAKIGANAKITSAGITSGNGPGLVGGGAPAQQDPNDPYAGLPAPNKNQNNAWNKTQSMLESARGNPAASQAEKDLYASQKANTLFNKYSDPNQMSNQETQLYATEIAKMASGGVPSIHELQGLNPNTLPASLSSIASKYANEPTSANAGEFMKRFKSYSDGLATDAQQVIQDKYGRVIETNKDAIGPRHYAQAKDQYINRFTAKPQSSDSQITPDVQDYATKHGITTAQALAIKNQRTGGK